MKYLHYFLVLIFTLIRKVVGLPMFWLAAPFRGYARNVVYNYKLNNGKWLKRLYERAPQQVNGYWMLKGGRTAPGKVKVRKVYFIEYFFVYWFLWGWLDDDSNRDVVDAGYIKTLLDGERKGWVVKLFGGHLETEYAYLLTVMFGNTFELGDLRHANKVSLRKCWLSTTLWVLRNTAYNFKYDQYETVSEKRIFNWKLKEKVFGWVYEDTVFKRRNYSLRFWETA